MADRPTHERPPGDGKNLFAAIGQQVLGLQSGADEDHVAEDERVKVVEEMESLCMNCEDNVGEQQVHHGSWPSTISRECVCKLIRGITTY